MSSDGQGIDFIYGVINWKEIADSETASGIAGEVGRALAAAPAPLALVNGADSPAWADGPNSNYVEAVVTDDLAEPLDKATL